MDVNRIICRFMFTVLIRAPFLSFSLFVYPLRRWTHNIVYCDRSSTKLNTIPNSLISFVNFFSFIPFILCAMSFNKKHERVILVRLFFRSLILDGKTLNASINPIFSCDLILYVFFVPSQLMTKSPIVQSI